MEVETINVYWKYFFPSKNNTERNIAIVYFPSLVVTIHMVVVDVIEAAEAHSPIISRSYSAGGVWIDRIKIIFS